MFWTVFFSPFFLSACSVTRASEVTNSFEYVVVKKVTDGDTFIDTKGQKYRILGIDAPEIGVFKNGKYEKTTGVRYYFANQAKLILSDLILYKKVKIKVIKKDKYGRKVVQISINSTEISQKMVSLGLAKVAYISSNKKDYFYYSDQEFIEELYKLQQQAMLDNLNIWSANIELIYPR